jgi:Peptidase family M28
MKRHWREILLLLLVAVALVGLVMASQAYRGKKYNLSIGFDGKRAMRDVEYQVALGPRIPGSPAHAQARDWMVQMLVDSGWNVNIQQAEMMGHPIYNVVAQWGEGKPWIILGAHYDSRLYANRDPSPENWSKPVPGANDGASGVAVLLELARVLPSNLVNDNNPRDTGGVGQVWLVFFDAEDNGEIPGWDWILGSRAFVQNLKETPDAAVIVDMVGDKNLKIYAEKNSDPQITAEIWETAASLGYAKIFIEQAKYRILDDHVPFIEAGIPAIDIIDREYLYWHFISDTPDKVSGRSMSIVGETLLNWLSQVK